MTEDINFAFRQLCRQGDFTQVKDFYYTYYPNIYDKNNLAFRETCRLGHLDISKWIYTLGPIDITANRHDAILSALSNNHLDVVKWLEKLSTRYRYSSDNNHLKIIRPSKSYNIDQLIEKFSLIRLEQYPSNYSYQSCPICQTDATEPRSSPPVILNCNHALCLDCFIQNYLIYRSKTCILCRTKSIVNQTKVIVPQTL